MNNDGQFLQKLKEFGSKIKKQGDTLIYFELAVVLTVIIVAVNYMFQYTENKISNAKSIKAWEYVYTDSEDEKFNGDLRNANNLVPMEKEKLGSYLHVKAKIDASDNDRTLIVNTDYAPIKIILNGKERYNNYYGKADYVGNSYNAIKIPASSSPTEIRISARLPFSTTFTMQTVEGVAHPDFSVDVHIIFSAVVILLSIGFFVFSAVIKSVKHKKIKFIAVFAAILVYGIATAAKALTQDTYYVNMPNFYNISVALENVSLAIIMFISARLVSMKNKTVYVLIFVDILAAAATCIFTNLWIARISFIASDILILGTLLLMVKENYPMLDRRVQYAKITYLMLLASVMIHVLCGIMMNTVRLRVTYYYCQNIMMVVFLCYNVFAQIEKTIEFTNPEEIQQKINQYNLFVEKVAELIKNIMAVNTENEICREACEGISSLCHEMGKFDDENELTVTALIKENGEYSTMYSIGNPGTINPFVVENRCLLEEKFCIYNETYFDMVFVTENDFHIIVHVENVKDGLDNFFISIMDTIFSCVRAKYIRMTEEDVDCIDADMQIFVDLAENCESGTADNNEHLGSVCFYTKTIMEQMGYPEEICEIVSKAAMLHDIGKIAIPLEIGSKGALLNEEERTIMKKHTDFGYSLLSVFDSDFLMVASMIAKHHHEKYDGTGYAGIKGEDINEFARIVSVSDVMDALMAKRSYKDPWPFEKVMDYIKAGSGKMFDPKVVEATLACTEIFRSNTEK